MSRVTDLLRSAVELNLRYTSTLLYLSKDYLKEVNGVIAGTPSPVGETPTQPPRQRPPLLLAGRAGEVAQGAFSINNSGEREMNVHLLVQGELGDRQVTVEPSRLTLKSGDSATIRVLAKVTAAMALDHDHLGSVVAPGLSSQAVPFIVRRLPDAKGDGGEDDDDSTDVKPDKPPSERLPRRRER